MYCLVFELLQVGRFSLDFGGRCERSAHQLPQLLTHLLSPFRRVELVHGVGCQALDREGVTGDRGVQHVTGDVRGEDHATDAGLAAS